MNNKIGNMRKAILGCQANRVAISKKLIEKQ